MKIIAWPARSNAKRNPYQSQLYDALVARGEFEVCEMTPSAPFLVKGYKIVHVHWPDAFLAADKGSRFWLRLLFLKLTALAVKLRGGRLVWTAHNLKRDNQRNAKRMERFFWPWFIQRIDGVIFMTEASATYARESLPALKNKPTAVIPHGHYLQIVKKVYSHKPNQHALPSALFFGSLTSYKNVWQVLESFLALPQGSARLAICGQMSKREPDLKLQTALDALPEERAGEVEYQNSFLSDEDLVKRITESDLVVFPYGDVLNSGAAIFALSVGRPILASDTALFRELRELVGADWVSLIDTKLDENQLKQALFHARALRNRRSGPDLTALDWPEIAKKTAAFYTELFQNESIRK